MCEGSIKLVTNGGVNKHKKTHFRTLTVIIGCHYLVNTLRKVNLRISTHTDYNTFRKSFQRYALTVQMEM